MERTKTVTPYPESVQPLVEEYRALLHVLSPSPADERIREFLIRHSDWSERGAATILALAKNYGTFMLANALALAEALEIEDGELGL